MTEAEYYNVVFYNSGQPLPKMKKKWATMAYPLLYAWFESDAIFR